MNHYSFTASETMLTIQALNHIGIDPNVRNGRPYILNTTITVADVVTVKLYHQKSADELAEWFDLELAQVYAALAYYYDHKASIEQQIRAQIQKAESLKQQHHHG